jgi:hypothetical protein
VWCTAFVECIFLVWQGFGVSGVPQLFGERVIVAGAGAAMVCACALAGRAMTLAARKIELMKGMYASLRVSTPVHSSLTRNLVGNPFLDGNIPCSG